MPLRRSALQASDVVLAVEDERDAAFGRPLIADAAGQPTRVYFRDADEIPRRQPVMHGRTGAPTGRHRDILAQDKPTARWNARLDILIVDADVTDVRKGEGYDLA